MLGHTAISPFYRQQRDGRKRSAVAAADRFISRKYAFAYRIKKENILEIDIQESGIYIYIYCLRKSDQLEQ